MTIIAALQLVSKPNVEENFCVVERLLTRFAQERKEHNVESEPTLIVLPECFAFFGGKDNENLGLKEKIGHGPIQTKLSLLAKQHNVWIVAGTIPTIPSYNLTPKNKASVVDDEKFCATSLLINNSGEIVADYQKIHLFDVQVADSTGSYEESRSTVAGQKIVVQDTPFGRVGMAICYDLRFPGLFSAMQTLEADVFVLPSAFTYKTGKAHWHTLIKARAIENQCYVIGSNQGGTHENGRETYGHSLIADPWGDVCAEMQLGEGIIWTKLCNETLSQIRVKMPVKEHNCFLSKMKSVKV